MTPAPSHQARSGFLLFWPFSSFRVETSDGLMTSCLIAGSMLSMNGSVAKRLQVDRGGRTRQHEARLGDVHLQLVLHLLLRSIDDAWIMPSENVGNRLRNWRSFGLVRAHSSNRMNAPLSDVSSIR